MQDAMGWENEEFSTFTVSQAFHVPKKSQNYLRNRNTSVMKLKRSLIPRFATVSRIAKTWTNSFNQYEFEPCLDFISLTVNLDGKTIQDTRQVLPRLANSRCIEVAIEIYVRLGEEEEKSKYRGQIKRGFKTKR